MTVVCPACDARFRDPPAEIPIERPVQCSKCEHEWIREEPVLATEMDDSVPMEAVLDNNSECIEINQSIEMPGDAEKNTSPPLSAETAVSTEVIEPLFVDRSPVASGRSRSLLLAPAAGLLCLGLLTAAVGMRHTIMDQMPGTKSAYKLAGFTVDKSGLEFANVKTITAKKDGIRQLIVRGDIQNTTGKSVTVPPIKLTMRGNGQADLYQWTVSTSKDALGSGETSRFTAIAHDYPGDAVDVEVEFAALPTENVPKAN